MTICERICSEMCTSTSRRAWINGARSRPWLSLSRALRQSWESLTAVISLRVLGRIPSMVIHAIECPRVGFAQRRRVTMISRCCNLSLEHCESFVQALTACDLPVVEREHARKGCPTNRCFPTRGRGALTPPSKLGRICAKNSVGLLRCTETRREEFSGYAGGLHAGLQ